MPWSMLISRPRIRCRLCCSAGIRRSMVSRCSIGMTQHSESSSARRCGLVPVRAHAVESDEVAGHVIARDLFAAIVGEHGGLEGADAHGVQRGERRAGAVQRLSPVHLDALAENRVQIVDFGRGEPGRQAELAHAAVRAMRPRVPDRDDVRGDAGRVAGNGMRPDGHHGGTPRWQTAPAGRPVDAVYSHGAGMGIVANCRRRSPAAVPAPGCSGRRVSGRAATERC